MNAQGNRGVKKKLKGNKQIGDVYSFLRGESGQAVLKVKVHHIEDVELEDDEIPPKPEYVPIEDSLGIAPAINTSTVIGSSLKGMTLVQLFKMESKNGKFVDWEWFQAKIKKASRRPSDNHLIITVKYDLEKGVRDIDVDDGLEYQASQIHLPCTKPCCNHTDSHHLVFVCTRPRRRPTGFSS